MSVEEEEGDLLKFDGHDNAVIGVADVWDTSGEIVERLIYSGEKVTQNLMAMGMDREEAEEFLSFNISGAYAGPKTPIIVWEHSLDELLEDRP